MSFEDELYELEEEEAPPKTARPGLPIEPRRLLRILNEERRKLLWAVGSAVALSLLASFFLPRTYKSSAYMIYEGVPLLDGDKPSDDVTAFADSTLSPSRLREVREKLGWSTSLTELKERLDVSLEGVTAIRIEAKADSGEDARALAQTALDVFLAQQASYNAERTDALRKDTELALERAKAERNQAMASFDTFRRESGNTDVLEQQAQLRERMTDLRARADEARVDVAAQQARMGELQRTRDELPREVVSTATVGRPVDEPLAEARAELATARGTLSEEHPRVRALQERVNSLQRQRQGETVQRGGQTIVANPARDQVERDLATTRAAFAAATEREAALRTLIESVRGEAELLAPAEGEARRVSAALTAADERVEDLTAKVRKLQDASVTETTGLRVLSYPVVPDDAKASPLAVLLLLLLPLLVALATAVYLIANRLRSLDIEAPREVAWWGRGPVLGTSVWPRDPAALASFVDEFEDHGVHGAGRTLVVPASEAERDVACEFAVRLSQAPWLAAAILDVEEVPRRPSPLITRSATTEAFPLVTPYARGGVTIKTPPPEAPARRLTADLGSDPAGSGRRHTPIGGMGGPVITPPAQQAPRPARKQTIVGLPAVEGESSPTASETAEVVQPARGVAKATLRILIHPDETAREQSDARSTGTDERTEAFLLARPVTMGRGLGARPSDRGDEPTGSRAVMRAAVRLLGNGDDDSARFMRSEPPRAGAYGSSSTSAIALAWNGPLSGPVLRRAARLAHRVVVVVSSGMNVVDLSRIRTRLGREQGVGYVLVNLRDEYVDLEDRVGEVEEFWGGPSQPEPVRGRTR